MNELTSQNAALYAELERYKDEVEVQGHSFVAHAFSYSMSAETAGSGIGCTIRVIRCSSCQNQGVLPDRSACHTVDVITCGSRIWQKRIVG